VAGLPLLRDYPPHAALARGAGADLSAGRFLLDAARLAARLPGRGHVLNLCDNRYRFAVGFAAALMRGQVSLLPPNDTPDLVERLAARYEGLYCLTDRAATPPALDAVRFAGEDADGAAAPPPVPAIPGERIAAIVFTSGSTGEPVPFPKSWRSLVASARAEIERLELAPGMSVLGTVPPQHSYGLESTVLMVMQGGLAMHAGRPFYPADVRAALASLPRPRCLVTSPAHLRVLLAERDALPPADLLLCATAPLSPQLAQEAESRFAAPLHEIYGCSEAGQVATRRTVRSEVWKALPGVRVSVTDKGAWVKGGHVEAEIRLSDEIEMRGPGRFLLHGRTADLVNVAGKRTSLAYLNYHLNSIEGVLDGVFVVPPEQPDAPSRLMAFVVAPGLDAETVMAALRRRIDAAFLPRPLRFVDTLPRNAVGKLPLEPLERMAVGLGPSQGAA
jgi:acyl-coenzyme A synthetase/AMP-(fatty) acid ligase